MAMILPFAMVKPKTTRGRPPCAHTRPGSPFTRAGCAARAPPDERLGHGLGAAHFLLRTRLHRGAVGPEHDVGIEHREQGGQVAAAGGGEECIDDGAMASAVGVTHGTRRLHPAARAARELACRGRGASDDGRDLVEPQIEQVVQHEGNPLGGGQRLEHYEHREAHRVGQERVALRVVPALRPRDGLGRLRLQARLAP